MTEDRSGLSRLHISKTGDGHNSYSVEVDGHLIRPSAVAIEFNAAAAYPVARITLPVVAENLDMLAVIETTIVNPGGDALEEC